MTRNKRKQVKTRQTKQVAQENFGLSWLSLTVLSILCCRRSRPEGTFLKGVVMKLQVMENMLMVLHQANLGQWCAHHPVDTTNCFGQPSMRAFCQSFEIVIDQSVISMLEYLSAEHQRGIRSHEVQRRSDDINVACRGTGPTVEAV